ncbi:MAG TPA: NfeD family protein [Candidatus Limnocylindrales bacterium]|nr:NfeD family protein [Candidatus Limnocylindrales bacterium]
MPTITIPIEDLVFVLAALVGGGLLLITVVLDDVLGGVLDAFHIDFSIGGISLMPPLLAFIAMFGVGGIFATTVLDLHGGPAALVGVVFGLAGFAVAFFLFRALKRAEGARPFSISDLVGHQGSVSVTIPAGRLGTVYVRAEGQNHEISATAQEDITSGTAIKVVGTAGMGLVVERLTPQPIAMPMPPPTPTPTAPSATATDAPKGDTTDV